MVLIELGPDVIVACPGRLLDFCNEGLISLSNIRFLVLDEADRMLEMGFDEQVRDVCVFFFFESPKTSSSRQFQETRVKFFFIKSFCPPRDYLNLYECLLSPI